MNIVCPLIVLLTNEHIQTTIVDNSASSTGSSSNSHACENTEDKVFLPSFKDYSNKSYGFSSSASRYCKTTDWARAGGAYYNSGFYNNGDYWTRSPSSSYDDSAYYVSYGGGIGSTFVGFEYLGVRPAITITLN